MDAVRWSDSQLRNYIDAEAALGWFADVSDREIARKNFRAELREAFVPIIQSRLLESVGALTNPEGLTMVCYDLVDDLRYKAQQRRWLLVCDEPWRFLADWVTEELSRTYRVTAGKKRPSAKALKEIERANQ